jgi:hypothetical protein
MKEKMWWNTALKMAMIVWGWLLAICCLANQFGI